MKVFSVDGWDVRADGRLACNPRRPCRTAHLRGFGAIFSMTLCASLCSSLPLPPPQPLLLLLLIIIIIIIIM